MADLTGRRKSGRLVRRTIRAGVVLLMIGVAECAVQRVVVVGVTVGAHARRYSVRSRQLEAGAGVVEGTIGPLRGVVAALAGRRQSRGGVIDGRQRVGVIVLMTRVAGRGRQVVVVVAMAVRTLTGWNHMRTG